MEKEEEKTSEKKSAGEEEEDETSWRARLAKSTSSAGNTLKRVAAVPARAWENRPWGRIARLRKKVEKDPADGAAQLEYVLALSKRSPDAAVTYVEATDVATGAGIVAAYLSSLVKAGKMTAWVSPAPLPSAAARDTAMATLLDNLRQRASPKMAADGEADVGIGTTATRPLHVAMPASWSFVPGAAAGNTTTAVAAAAPPGNPFLRFLRDVLYTMLVLVFVSILWLCSGAALRRSLQGPSTSSATSSSATTSSSSTSSSSANNNAPSSSAFPPGLPSSIVGGNKDNKDGKSSDGANAGGSSSAKESPYAPKEYNKETMDAKHIKSFADVKGCDEAKEELAEIVDYLRNPAKFSRLGGKLPKGVLLTGPPGTGKTLLAKATAGEAGVPFLYRSGSEFEEMFVGVGSRRVRTLFQTAKKKAPCIVFIDELDSVGGSRKQWESHTRKTLNQLLVEMDGFEANEGVIVLAATNLPESLDAALTRPGRFDRHVAVPNPDVKGRREILELYLQDKPYDKTSVNIDALARGTTGFSGADLYNLVNTAAVQAAMENLNEITGPTLEFAKDKILMGAERKSAVISEENRKLTAYHESGHAIVALLTRGAYPVHKATIMPRGNALGMVMQLPDKDETSQSKQQMLARLDVCMGGRVAEELIFGSDMVTTGARGDLRSATSLARHMVMHCGMSDEVGPVYISDEDRSSAHSTISPSLLAKVDTEVMRLLREADARVSRLLKAHESDLHKLAGALLDKETLDGSTIRGLLSPTLQAKAEAAGNKLDAKKSVKRTV